MAVVTCPKLGSPNVPVGLLKCGVFVKFSDSNRNSAPNRSVIRNLRKREKSRLIRPGPVRTLRPTLPRVLEGGAANFDMSNQSSPRPTLPRISGVPVTLGRFVLPGAFRDAEL